MATRGKLEVDIEVKSKADKFWRTIRDFVIVFPKVFPNVYKSIEILEGDGKAIGSICRHITYGEDGSLQSSTEKIEAVDDVKKTFSYIVIDGDLLHDYKKFKGHISVTPKGDGSEVKWIAEYEKAYQEVPDPTIIKDSSIQSFLELDSYIQNA